MKRVIEINGTPIGEGRPPFVVAEISGNHNGDLNRAFALIDAAKAAGADAVKLQTYTADSLTLDVDGPGFVVEGGLWAGRRLYDLYKEAATPWDWMEPLFAHAVARGLTVFSSPFDDEAVALLERLNAPAYKIASFEMHDLDLVRRCASTARPLIISTGMANLDDIAATLDAARSAGAAEIVLLHCVSGYPTPAADMNLLTIPDMAARFDVLVGLSDHTLGVEVSVAAAALGAALIEKHVTLRRVDGGPDAAFSLEPEELAALCSSVKQAAAALGRPTYDVQQSEKANTLYRRSLYVVRDVTAGQLLTADDVRSIRPGYGLPPKNLSDVIGRAAREAIPRGTPLRWDLIV